eukprot:3629191-Pleurochrysis_carterae.AAC.1
MVQPPFLAWLNRSKVERTTLVIEFKIVKLHESGMLDWPPNCVYPEAERQRTLLVALKALAVMVERKPPVSADLCSLLGTSLPSSSSSMPAPSATSSSSGRKLQKLAKSQAKKSRAGGLGRGVDSGGERGGVGVRIGVMKAAEAVEFDSQNLRHSAKATYSLLVRRWGEWRRDGPTYTS